MAVKHRRARVGVVHGHLQFCNAVPLCKGTMGPRMSDVMDASLGIDPGFLADAVPDTGDGGVRLAGFRVGEHILRRELPGVLTQDP